MSAISIENHPSSPGSLVATVSGNNDGSPHTPPDHPNKHAKHSPDASAHQTPHVSNQTDAGRKMPTQQLAETTGTRNRTMSTADSDMSLSEDEGRHNKGTSVNDPFMTNPRPHTRYNPRDRVLPELTLNPLDEEEEVIPSENTENPHGRLDYSGPESKTIRNLLNMTFLNDGQFQYAVFYPSDLLQGVSNPKIPMLLSGNDLWVAVVFFNGGNAMHQKIRTTIKDVEAFLTSIGCEFQQGQTISPFYDNPPEPTPNTNENPKRGRGAGRGGRGSRGRGRGATTGVEPKPNPRLKYTGPNTVFIRITSSDIQDTLLRIQTFALSRILAFHMVPIDINRRPSVVCLLYSTVLDNGEHTQQQILYSIKQKLRVNNPVFSALLAPHVRLPGSTKHKICTFVNSMDLVPAGYETERQGRTVQVWVLYAAPLASGSDYNKIDANEKAIGRYIASLRFEFINLEENTSIDSWGEQTECSLCKLTEHHFFMCPFKTEPWSGPMDHIDACIEQHPESLKQVKALTKV
ncbi:hypothetical protein C8R41DRAFT_925546 [Lentinula lateritia]|uniref:Uncharacterized protein n=1 Tax=Lentinula lateritia TaxID=40482 RepID=A0ABQ8V0G3_9AGAR|nr:hypothetical protein C8R41DRAFT_925546 [Lentinula lateritia]